jgi:hypothetical protein
VPSTHEGGTAIRAPPLWNQGAERALNSGSCGTR